MALSECSLGGLPYCREGLYKQFVQSFTAGYPFAKPAGASGKFLVAQVLELCLQRVNRVHAFLKVFKDTVVLGTEQGLGDGAEHGSSRS